MCVETVTEAANYVYNHEKRAGYIKAQAVSRATVKKKHQERYEGFEYF